MLKTLLAAVLMLCGSSAYAEMADHGSLLVDGQERHHYLFVPEGANADTPLVIALHGMGGNASNLRHGIGLTEQMATIGAAVVYPQGLRLPQGSRHWNAGFDFMPVDDIAYLTTLTRTLVDQHGLSEDVIFFGISMGGYMAYHMACRSELSITAIVVVAGTMPAGDIGDCKPAPQTSLLHIHGMRDPLIPFHGGGHWSDPDSHPVGVPEIVQSWADQIGATPATRLVTHPEVDEVHYVSRSTRSEVQLLQLPNFGHDWPSKATLGYAAIEDVTAFIARVANIGPAAPQTPPEIARLSSH